MEKERQEAFLRGISGVTGIPKPILDAYAESNSPLNILEHPRVLSLSAQQYEKVEQLNAFLRAFNTLKQEQEQPQGFESSMQVARWFQSMVGNMKDHERMLAAYVNDRMELISVRTISEGSINESPVYPRQVLKQAMEEGASGIFLCHNHPGGTNRPSQADIEVTEKVRNILEPMGITVHDHFIVTERSYASFVEMGFILEDRPVDIQARLRVPTPEASGSRMKCIAGMANLLGVAEESIYQLTKDTSPVAVMDAPETIPLTGIQFERMSLLSSFHMVWQEVMDHRPGMAHIGSTIEAGAFAMRQMGNNGENPLLVLCLNAQNQVIESAPIRWNQGLVDPKQIVAKAVATDCTSMILCRNTMEAEPTVMEDDRRLAYQVGMAMNIMSIKLVDYVINNTQKYVSLAELGMLVPLGKAAPDLTNMVMQVREDVLHSGWDDREQGG